jgi:hypothetical protein
MQDATVDLQDFRWRGEEVDGGSSKRFAPRVNVIATNRERKDLEESVWKNWARLTKLNSKPSFLGRREERKRRGEEKRREEGKGEGEEVDQKRCQFAMGLTG